MTIRQTRTTTVNTITQAQYDEAAAARATLTIEVEALIDQMITRIESATTSFDHDANEIEGYALNVKLNRLDYYNRFLAQPISG